LIIIFILIFHVSVFAGQIRNIISTNTISTFLLAQQNVEYEKIFNNRCSILVSLAISNSNSLEINKVKIIINEQRIAYRYYLSHKFPAGLWVGSNLAYSSGNLVKDENYKSNINMILAGVESGYRFFINGWNNFNISPFITFRVKLTDDFLGNKKSSGTFSYPFYNFNMFFGLNVGWGW